MNSVQQSSITHSFNAPLKSLNYYPDEDLFQSMATSNEVLNTNSNLG